jgi:hypothetical protein
VNDDGDEDEDGNASPSPELAPALRGRAHLPCAQSRPVFWQDFP